VIATAFSISPRFRDPCKDPESNVADLQGSVRSLAHNAAPVSPPQHGGGTVQKLPTSSVRTRVVREQLRTKLTEVFRDTVPGSPKEVAYAIGDEVSPETIKQWRQAIPKAVVTFAAIGNAYPLLTLQSADLMGVDLDQDLRAFAEFLSLQRRIRGQ